MMFRVCQAVVLLAAMALSACVSEDEPLPPPFTLDGEGISPTVSQLRIDFGRAQVGVIDTVSRLLQDRPLSVSTNPRCGGGAVTSARWASGLTLNFVDGTFLGWTSSDPDLPVAGGFIAGQFRQDMPIVSFQVTDLGTEFNRGPIFGILDDTETSIRLLYSGVTCFFR